MELARALTSRKRQAPDISLSAPGRAVSMRKAGSIKRSAISSPLELISTTNVLAFDAPNIYGSSDESDSSLTFSMSSAHAETSSIESAPSPVEPNHLSTYFKSAAHSGSTRQSNDSSDCDSPTIPSRALSHTKKSHQASALRRSASNKSKTVPPPNAIHDTAALRSSIDMFSSTPKYDEHPFGAELAKVNELADEIGAQEVLVLDEEEQYLISQGFCKFGADDYVDEIQGLFGGSYNNPFSPMNAVWI